jgi:hypothetical protein
MPVIPTLGRLRQKHHGFKSNLGYIVNSVSKKKGSPNNLGGRGPSRVQRKKKEVS